VIIVARGGGSLEDLWGFNDEAVVRAAAESGIPLVSAVGHETDTTLIDYAADLRAPTPTGAAEMIVPVRAELLAANGDLAARLAGGLRRLVERRKTELRGAVRALPSPENLLAQPRQRLDLASQRLPGGLRAGLDARRIALSRLANRLEGRSPRAELARRRGRLESVADRLANALTGRLNRASSEITRDRERLHGLTNRMLPALHRQFQRRQERLDNAAKLLKGYSYQGVLDRGFALVLNEGGHPVRTTHAVSAGMALTVRMADGAFGAVVTGEGTGARPKQASAKPSPGKPTEPVPQNDLFN
jgi:exodeoxyribonuclease VII large subunit